MSDLDTTATCRRHPTACHVYGLSHSASSSSLGPQSYGVKAGMSGVVPTPKKAHNRINKRWLENLSRSRSNAQPKNQERLPKSLVFQLFSQSCQKQSYTDLVSAATVMVFSVYNNSQNHLTTCSREPEDAGVILTLLHRNLLVEYIRQS